MKLRAPRRWGSRMRRFRPRKAALPPVSPAELRLKKILLPLDFSACSQKALHYGIAFARQFGAELLLLHVMETVYPPPELLPVESSALDRSVREEAERNL